MKKKLLTILALSAGIAATAQNESGAEKRGAKLFNEYDYVASSETFEAIQKKNVDILRKLAESYDMMADYAKSEQYHAQICESKDRVAKDLINYARVLMKNRKYAEAEKQMEAYGVLNPGDVEAQRFNLLNELLQKYDQYGKNYTVANMGMNTPQEDFAPVMYENQLYFSSSRSKTKMSKRRWIGNDLPFLDVYVADVDQQDEVVSWWFFPDKDINKKYHDGPITFSRNGNEMFITRNNYEGKGQDGTRNLKLLTSTKTAEGWSDPVELPFNSKDFSIGHAALSPDGTVLVFASDMPGGKGGVDLYRSTRTGSGWSTPENMAIVNTSGNEMFPYIHESGILIFASNGHPGYGGLDLFAGQWKNNDIKRFENLGAPMNSPADDFSVWIDAQQKEGYFASNRSEGKGNDDIYRFTLIKPFSFGRTISGVATDRNGQPLGNARVRFMSVDGELNSEVVTGADGKFEFETDKTGPFSLAAVKEKYFEGVVALEVKDESPDVVQQDVILEKDPGFALAGIVTEKGTKAPLDGVKVLLVNNMTGTQEIVATKADGAILRPIHDKKVNDRISYNIRLEKPGYVTKSLTYNRALDREGKYVVSDEMNMAMEKIDVGLDLAKAYELKPIFFDLNKFVIRPDAAIELDKIVRIMNDNPTMVVELGAHTDCRGTAAKNQELSQKRALASAEYIKARISKPERIYGMGYGESKLLNSCGCEGKVKSKCSEGEHQVNRRTEFLIIKM